MAPVKWQNFTQKEAAGGYQQYYEIGIQLSTPWVAQLSTFFNMHRFVNSDGLSLRLQPEHCPHIRALIAYHSGPTSNVYIRNRSCSSPWTIKPPTTNTTMQILLLWVDGHVTVPVRALRPRLHDHVCKSISFELKKILYVGCLSKNARSEIFTIISLFWL